MNMHIIIDATTTQDQFAYAGVGQYTKNIVLSLAKLYPNTKYSVLLFDKKESTLEPEINNCKNVSIERIGEYKLNDYKNDFWYYIHMLPKIKQIKKKDSIYFCPYFWRNFPSNFLPTVLFVHDMNLPLFDMYSQQSKIHNWIRKMQYWFTLDKSLQCKKIICNSETTRNDYLKFYPEYRKDSIMVTYLGIDLEEKEISLEKLLPSDYREKGYIIYIGGGINKTKNSSGVIKGYASFLKLLNKEKHPYLVIAGGKFQDKSRKEVKELYKLIEEYDIKKDVIFTGFYTDESKYSLLKNSFSFIHLSIYEGFGVSVGEALRVGIPTIIDKCPVNIELFDDVSAIVDGTKEEVVGKKILDIYTHPEKYRDMVRRGYELSKTFTWNNTAKRTYDVFKSITQDTELC